ncbi:thrombopoietin receptor [Xiphophorus hellerii]|uniref:thrombopoietin receptor n=1 Tax=Xiphophorus hellerii TaxID=8084 RepID=UPI0013B3C668|nr:thrombopoietin receptor [Xiphophorus hellerii]
MMTQHCIWEIFLFSLWMHFDLMPFLHCNADIEHNLSKQDVLLIQDEEDPKCFTRTMTDFTCFFETTDNGTYDFLYNIEWDPSKKCKMSTDGTENGTFLHVCSFPRWDIFTYVGTEVKVVDQTKNIILYKRTVYVEDLCLLDPPSIVSLQPGDTVGKMLISLDTNLKHIWKEKYRICYSSKTLGEKTVEGKDSSVLLSLEPGEEVEFQASVKCENGPDAHPGYWSAWSKPVRAIVPQSADDISLVCFTSDLQRVTCHWNSTKYGAENDYKLFYNSSQPSNWMECQDDGNLSDTCSFHGDKSGAMKVKLSSTAAPLKRLFFSKEIELKKSIKSGPPSHLKGELINDKLCLEWEAPLPSLLNHMVFEVDVQIKAVEDFRITKQRNTSMCVRLSSGGQFSVKVRAKPDGSIYSGHWSDWSDVLLGTTTDNTDMQLVWCFYISILVITISFITTILLCRRKLKLFFWPPVPNLEKVLQGFLTDINQQKWDPPVTSKLYFEETTSSVVEIMSAELPVLNKPTEEFDFLSSDGSFSIEDQADGSSGSETLRDYVTLKKDLSIHCLKENCYVYEQFKDGKDPEEGDKLYTTCCCLKPCSCNNYFNHSYLPLSQSTDSLSKNINVRDDESNLYTNLSLD